MGQQSIDSLVNRAKALGDDIEKLPENCRPSEMKDLLFELEQAKIKAEAKKK